MNLLSSVTNTQYDHLGQKVLGYRAQLHSSLLKESSALPQKKNTLQQELVAKFQAQDVQQQEKVKNLVTEIRCFKKLPPKPNIKPDTKSSGDSRDSSGDPSNSDSPA